MSYLIGCDPELFLSRGGKTIGSERVVPEVKSIVMRDGIQVELNPPASMSPAILGSWISQAFRNLDRMVKAQPGVEIDFNEVVEVERAELDSLSERSRILLCTPSKNIYGPRPSMSEAERAAYRIRSAGGHLHFGLRGDLYDERLRMVTWFDVFVGNTCVLIDRDPKAIIRREHYGRAGEYRIPNYGLEYRTLSNFWLRNFTLLDFVFSLSKIAIGVVEDSLNGGELESRLIEVVDINRVIKAIDENNLDLAWKNWKDLTILNRSLVGYTGSKLGLFNQWPMLSLMAWFEKIEKNGLDKVFLGDPVDHWLRGKQVPFSSYIMHA